jgi:hypothetical protein
LVVGVVSDFGQGAGVHEVAFGKGDEMVFVFGFDISHDGESPGVLGAGLGPFQ